jgi:RNase H-like domain found in reverse transcriptase
MEEAKVDKVKQWKPPRDVTQVQCFLGFTGYYRYFIQGYSQLARPLLDLTKKGTPWHWGDEQQKAFNDLKTKMCQKPVLANPDLKKTFYLQTDASNSSAGAVLS